MTDPGSTTRPPIDFPVVGIGASAGGVSAFEAFFGGLPVADLPAMAFVIVQHLAPDHTSILSDILRRFTHLEVFEAAAGMAVRPYCIYVIPPGHDLGILNGTLQLFERTEPHGRRLAIDFFFRSLAQDLRSRSIGIVLSGTGTDGSLGVRAIKAEGGLVIAQAPDSAEFSGMPDSAIATGVVDFQRAPADMPGPLIDFIAHAHHGPAHTPDSGSRNAEVALGRILGLLRTQTGHDFSQYKPSTVMRRVERRMAVHQISTMDAYARYLQQSAREVEALFHDMLIGVTNFFRDPECFKALDALVVQRLVAAKRPEDTIRVWIPGCSSGEEAYSIAMLLHERQEAVGARHRVFIFATDLDAGAIAMARAGRYPASIAADVSPERLARHFDADIDGSGFRVRKELRDMLVFSEQDLIRDPPFSRLDLLVCRNLLIYLGPELQKRLIPLFHYSLNPGGFLFLGSSETVGDFQDLFSAVDRKLKLYLRRDDQSGPRHPVIISREPAVQTSPPLLKLPMTKTPTAPKPSWRDVTEQALLRQLSPAGVLVNARGDILYIHGRTGPYLELAPGEAGTANVLGMAREGLRQRLSTALFKAAASRNAVQAHRVRIKDEGRSVLVDLSVVPVNITAGTDPADAAGTAGSSAVYLVVFAESPRRDVSGPTALSGPADASTASAAGTLSDVTSARITELEFELLAKDEYLRVANEAMEVSNQDLKASNEELQSVNEELQSTNEELETSKEEMQSINEELSTVNTELHAKLLDLSRANNDITNLLAGTGIATVFVDMKLQVLRFTPSATALINLIKSDIGRPVAHVVTNLIGYDRLVQDVQAVLDTLVPRELEVQSADGNWYTLRMQPYRTIENVIEGGVITFVDITHKKLTEAALKRANETLRLAVVVRDSSDAISVHDLDGRILAWNPAAVRLYGWSEEEALDMNVRERIPAASRDRAMAEMDELVRSPASQPYIGERLARDRSTLVVSITASALVDGGGRLYAIATTERRLPAAPGAPGQDRST